MKALLIFFIIANAFFAILNAHYGNLMGIVNLAAMLICIKSLTDNYY